MKIRFANDEIPLVETDQAHRLKIPVSVIQSVRRKLRLIRQANDERDLYAVKSLHYEKLKGDLDGKRSIKINKQWRLILIIDREREPLEVEITEITNHYE